MAGSGCARRMFLWALGLGLATSPAFAVQEPDPAYGVLPDFDSRRFPGELRQAAPLPDQLAELTALEQGLGAPLRARWNPLSGTLRSLSLRGGRLTGPETGSSEEIARRFVDRHPALLGGAGRTTDLLVERVIRERGSGVVHVRWIQTLHGLDLFDGVIRVHLDASGRIYRLAGSPFRVAPGRHRSLADDFRGALAPEEAVLAASRAVRPEYGFHPRRREGPEGTARRTVFEPGPYAESIRARWIYFPTLADARPAWLVELRPRGFPQDYQVIVDAFDGTLLHRFNRVRYAAGGGRILDAQPDTIDVNTGTDTPDGSPLGSLTSVSNLQLKNFDVTGESPAGILDDSGYLKGNNVHVFNGGSPTEGENHPDFIFDFPFNHAGSSQANLFNVNNFVHDYFYLLGFDEVNGSFQKDNFGLLPPGDGDDDEVYADSRDTAGRNNASFNPPPDGQHGNMNMFLWDPPAGGHPWAEDVDGDGTLDLDGSYDSDIIIHEFHHGVSHRLAGGRLSSSCFSGDESGAMGEGGGDFFAYTVNDDSLLSQWIRPPNGLRRVNSKTYGDFSCQSPRSCSVHTNGQIWANVLWDTRQRFIADNVGGARFRALDVVARLYIDGLKTAACDPDMLEMRDAMIDADQVSHGGRSFCRLWETFAARGMGVSAVAFGEAQGPPGNVEAFDVPIECQDGGPPPPLPGEVLGVRFDAGDTLVWDPEFDAASYEVYRTALAALAFSDYGSCISASDPDPQDVSFTDSELLAPGAADAYLVGAINASGAGSLGTASDTTQRTATLVCP